jgi:hypothetical protein
LALINFAQDVGPTIDLIDRALALNPGSTLSWNVSGWVRVVAGDPDPAIVRNRRPAQPALAATVQSDRGRIAHFLANRLDQAAAMLLGSIRYCLPM